MADEPNDPVDQGNQAAADAVGVRSGQSDSPATERPQPSFVKSGSQGRFGWVKEHRFEIAILFALWLVATAVFWPLANGHVTPRRYQDEFFYWALAKSFPSQGCFTFSSHGIPLLGLVQSFANGDCFTWRGQATPYYSPLYVIVISFAFHLGDTVPTIYKSVHFLNAAMMPAVIFPTFWLARQFVGRYWALLVALLAIAVPAMNYIGVIGTEVLGYPAAVFAFAAMVVAIIQPQRKCWLLAFFAIGLAVVSRTQFVIMLPIYLGSIGVAGLFRARSERRAFFDDQRDPLIVFGGLAVLGALAYAVVGQELFGIYGGAVDQGTPALRDVWYWLKGFTGDVFLFAAIAPVVATLALGFTRDTRRNPAIAALLAVTLVATAVFVAQNTWFSATNPYDWRHRNIFYERYQFYLGPLFFVGFVLAWKRVTTIAVGGASLVAALVLTVFSKDNVLVPFSYDSFGLTLIGERMQQSVGFTNHLGSYLAIIAVLISIPLLIATLKDRAVAMGGMVAVTVLVAGVLAFGQVRTWTLALRYSKIDLSTQPNPVDFIDEATDHDVGMLITGTDSPDMYFKTEFWNNRVQRAFVSKLPPFNSPIVYSPTCEFDWDVDGTILGTGCTKVPSAFYLRSETIAMHLRNTERDRRINAGIRLLVAKSPARLFSLVSGRNVTTGAVDGNMQVRTFLNKPGRLRIDLRKSRGSVVRVNNRVVQIDSSKVVALDLLVKPNDHLFTLTFEKPNREPGKGTVEDVRLKEGSSSFRSVR